MLFSTIDILAIMDEETKEKLRNLELHEELEIRPNLSILRVAGGWLYHFTIKGNSTAMFVPISNYRTNVKPALL